MDVQLNSGYFNQITLPKLIIGLIITLSSTFSLAVTTSSQSSLTPVTMCVFDIIGKNGPMHGIMSEYKTAAMKWGVDLSFKSYTNDRIAAEDFNAGICDLVNLPGIRARNYNHFTGTINSIGAIPTYKHLNLILSTLSTPQASKYMRQGDYEVVSISPTGALFGFVIDRSINSPEKLAGKKITVLDNAPESEYLVKSTGMTPIKSTITNALQKFNSHVVDITGAPAIAYEPMELYKGLEPNGGIIDWPLHQTTMQIVARWTKLPAEFGQNSRNYSREYMSTFMEVIETSEERIPKKYWINIPKEVKVAWNDTHRENRIALRNQGIYNAKALTLFRKVRCKLDPTLAECTSDNKE